MVRIRLKRTGTRNALCFRVVVMDQRSSRDGKAIEELGFYNPRSKEEKINLERADYWMSVGADVSETAKDIIDRVRAGYVVDMFHFEFWPSYPVFNVADICVVIGALLGCVYYMWLYEKYDMKPKSPKEDPADGETDAPTE